MVSARRSDWRTLVALLALCGLLIPTQLYIAIPLGVRMTAAVDAPSGWESWMTGSFAAAYAFGFLLLGVLADGFGRRSVLAWGALALAVTTALVPFAPSLGALLALRLLQGLAAATFAPAALACVVDIAPAERRLPALACVTTGLISSALVGQIYGELAEPAWGYRGAFLAAACAYGACAILLAWLIPTADRVASPGPVGEVLARMAELVRRPPLRVMFLCGLTVFGTFVALSSVLRLRLTDTFGLSHTEVVAVELASLVGVALSPLAHALTARFGAERVVVAAFVAAAAATGLEAAASSVIVLTAGSLVFVAGIAVVNPALVGLISLWAPDARGAALAFNTFVLFSGATLGAFMPELLGESGVYALVIAALIAAALAIARGVPSSIIVR